MVRWPLTYFWVWVFWWGQTWCSCPCLANPGTIHLGCLEAERWRVWWLGRVDFSSKKMDSSRLISPWTLSWPCEIPLFFWKPGGFYEKNLWFLRILDFFPRLRHHPWRPGSEALKPWNRSVWWWCDGQDDLGSAPPEAVKGTTWASWWNFFKFHRSGILHFRYCNVLLEVGTMHHFVTRKSIAIKNTHNSKKNTIIGEAAASMDGKPLWHPQSFSQKNICSMRGSSSCSSHPKCASLKSGPKEPPVLR